MTVSLAIVLGLAAGVVAGMFGVGGGILFVPALLALGLGQVEAQATSLAAILPTVAAGTWYFEMRRRAWWRTRGEVASEPPRRPTAIPAALARASPGNKSAARMAMMAMTTSSSIRVNALAALRAINILMLLGASHIDSVSAEAVQAIIGWSIPL